MSKELSEQRTMLESKFEGRLESYKNTIRKEIEAENRMIVSEMRHEMEQEFNQAYQS